MSRPAVDVVVPFVGSEAELLRLCAHLSRLTRNSDDSIVVVDNRPQGQLPARSIADVLVITAPALQSSYHARNRGVGQGHAPWLLFVDADVRLPPDLIGRFFERPPGERTGILAGEIANELPADTGKRHRLAVRYAYLAELFAQRKTVSSANFSYAMTANCAILREAFDAAGGFVEHVRSGGDADICFRLRASGWEIESRDEAVVTHVSRATLRKLLRQSAKHGSGAAWLEANYPGFSRQSRLSGLALRSARRLLHAATAGLRGDRDTALVASIDVARSLAFELGRRLSNEVGRRLDTAGGVHRP